VNFGWQGLKSFPLICFLFLRGFPYLHLLSQKQGGFAKWDTSGPAAVLEAHGGTMSKLPPFLKDKTLQS